MNYDEAIAYMQNAAAAGIKPGLERITALLGRLGSPERGLKAVHVGGTNGKGSVCALLTGVLTAAGYKTGSFTSPHLHSYTERFRINGVPVERARLAGLIREVRPALDALRREGTIPTEFEIHTALAFLLFAQEAVDVAVVEVGLGGRYDATNVVLPEAAVITNVGLDHTDYLGESLERIAWEKAGIIKPGVPVVTGAEGPALTVIAEECAAKKAPLFVLGRDFDAVARESSLAGQVFDIRDWLGGYSGMRIRLLGRHQLDNAACAVAVARLFGERGWGVDETAVREGLAAAAWPGRLEVVKEKPLVVLDGAHNAAGAQALKEALEEYFPGRRIVLLLGIFADKERAAVAATLCPMAAAVVVTRPPGPRAGDWREVAALAQRYAPAVFAVEEIPAAVAWVLSLAEPEDVAVITGSLYLIAEARAVLTGRGFPKN
ncbi:MAG TPA: bifunctional folylpolyglutamate synthase/dihydrofolate synthase [Desulfotomaculum sp.]|nr:bifunctional folylpolyglutamate synthase/dihydrofolate synthase [Desulfotomaculum sp.]